MEETVLTLTEKQARVLEILRDAGEGMFASDIAAIDEELFASGARSVTPLAEGLVKKGLAEKSDGTHMVYDAKADKEVEKTHKVYALTEEGQTVDYSIK